MKDIKRKIARYNTFWEDKLTESRFWKAIALSYIEQDVKLEEQQIFITQISFYPRLIEVLLSTLNKANTKVTVNILFFLHYYQGIIGIFRCNSITMELLFLM